MTFKGDPQVEGADGLDMRNSPDSGLQNAGEFEVRGSDRGALMDSDREVVLGCPGGYGVDVGSNVSRVLRSIEYQDGPQSVGIGRQSLLEGA